MIQPPVIPDAKPRETITFINKDGTTYSQYRWEILRDGLLIVWQKGASRLNGMEAPGVYTSIKKNGIVVRLEKVE